jgi:hypothetical protein
VQNAEDPSAYPASDDAEKYVNNNAVTAALHDQASQQASRQ